MLQTLWTRLPPSSPLNYAPRRRFGRDEPVRVVGLPRNTTSIPSVGLLAATLVALRNPLASIIQRAASLKPIVKLGLATFALTGSGAMGCSAPPPLAVADNVDLGTFQGKWYEIARLPRATQADCNGTTAFYTQNTDGSLTLVNQCNLGSPTGDLYTVAMSASVPDTTVPAKLALQVDGFTGDYWILEVGPNYEYAVVGHPSRLYWWLLSRTPTLDATTTEGILNRATAEAFDMSHLEYTQQPPAGERASLDAPEGPVPQPMTTGCTATRGGSSSEGLPALATWGVALGLVTLRRRRRR